MEQNKHLVCFSIQTHLCVHTRTLQSTCWQIKVQSRTGLDQYTYSRENTNCVSVCVSWPVFNSPLMWPDYPRVSSLLSFFFLMWLIQRHQWDAGSCQLNMMFVLTASAGGWARGSYHASTCTGRQIHCVRAEWGTPWIMCTQYSLLYEYTVMLNGLVQMW